MRGTASASGFAGAEVLLEAGMRQRLSLAWRLLRDPRVAPGVKMIAPALAILYVLSPIDLIPDLLLGLGQIDDLGVLAVVVMVLTRLLPRLAPPDVLAEHMRRMGMDASGPEKADSRRDDVMDAEFRVQS